MKLLKGLLQRKLLHSKQHNQLQLQVKSQILKKMQLKVLSHQLKEQLLLRIQTSQKTFKLITLTVLLFLTTL
jgi:hypothetical protein